MRHPLHPRPLAARGRAAADHDARLARLGHRAAGLHRSADRPDRARRHRRGRIPPGAALASRLRLLRRADRARLGPRPRRAGLGGADEPPRLHPLRRPGRRRGRRRHRRDGPPGARGSARHPHQPAGDGARRRGFATGGHRCRNAPRSTAIKTFQASGNGYFVEQATRPQTIGYALLDSPVALAAWMLDHDTDAYYKISRAFVDGQPSGNLTRDHILDNITMYWLTGTGASAARSYWEDYGPDAPGAGRPASSAAPGPGRLHHLPRRDLADPAQLGREVLPHPQLLLRGRQGRPLRRLGGARALRGGAPGRVPPAAPAQGPRAPPLTVGRPRGLSAGARPVGLRTKDRSCRRNILPEHLSAVAAGWEGTAPTGFKPMWVMRRSSTGDGG